ncbi:GNAT family N-acetyltransferase [Geodermatophilus ruber]|uniref:Acyl-CoA synthetase (NDP forming) n=1 Tax=Geodermatophilus ruber TaxID=504800 RepID=A0A1I4C964_9ACTN|nr:GNAT family N-acetyltransferase [Geodermatophilus ruber]SFK77652.1 Acyl-CoA synthetase (NDP forming) [Geodermatophilus ruber]
MTVTAETAAARERPVPGIVRPARVLLRDGSPALVAQLGPEDTTALLTLHESLTDRDRYLRFATLHPTDLEAYLERTLAPTSGARTLGARVRSCLIGAVQLIPTGGDAAEVAAVVDPRWRHEGVATVLLEELAGLARRMGVQRLLAQVLAENGPMMRVLTDLGLPLSISREGAELQVEVVLHSDDRYETASEDRHRHAAAASLDAVLHPRTVAVVGAGRSETSIGRAVLRSLRAAGFPGAVYAVNPGATEIEGVASSPSVGALPEPVDLAVVCVPVAAVERVVEQCGERGVRALLILTGGLAAVPGLGERVRELIDRHAMRMVGPNSVGVATPAAQLDATFAGAALRAGDLGLVAQSGGVVIAAVAAWQRLGLGLSAMVAVGDAHDIGARDVLAWFDEDPGTALVVLYAESEPDLRGLVRTAAHLAGRVPVLALEPGISPAGARAAASHTARAATPRAIREAAYAAAGIQTVPDLTTLAATVGLLRGQPLPRAGTVVVLTNVGGGGVLAADACAAAGLPLQPLSAVLQGGLRALLPPLASTGNPVDTGAAVPAEVFAATLARLLDEPTVSAVMTVTAPTGVSDPGPGVAAAAAAHAARGGATPVIDVRLTQAPAVERRELPGAPEGRFLTAVSEPVPAARALAAATRRTAWLNRPTTATTPPPGVDVLAARTVVTGVLARVPLGDWLLPEEVRSVCAAAGIPMVATSWAPSAAEAAAAATWLGTPVAVKGHVRGVVHKADAGLLRLPVNSAAEVAHVVGEWADRAGPDWLGAVVQPMIALGDELLVGAVRDAAAGAVVALGPGGRAADALGHRVHRLAPLRAADAEAMLADSGLFNTPHGGSLDHRGIVDCLQRMAWLADAVPEVVEAEINPLVATPGSCRALDVRVRVAAVES